MKKYSLIASKGKEITVADVTWAKAIADYNVGIMISAAQNLADTKFERKKNHVVEFIMKRGGMITKTQFANNCRIFESSRERAEIIADLIEAGRLRPTTIEGSKAATGYEIVK